MVAKNNIQETISIPANLTQPFKQELGNRILNEVRDRTNRGIDKNSKQFKGYTTDYKASRDFKTAGKSSQVDLQLSGDMIAEIEVISINSSSIIIGYATGSEFAGQVEGNTIGSYGKASGSASKARDFIGLPDSVVNRLVAEMRAEPQFAEQSATRSSLVSNILGRF